MEFLVHKALPPLLSSFLTASRLGSLLAGQELREIHEELRNSYI